MHRDVPAIRTISRQTCGVVLTRVLNAQNRGYLELPPLCTDCSLIKMVFLQVCFGPLFHDGAQSEPNERERRGQAKSYSEPLQIGLIGLTPSALETQP